ncbi:phage portal protein [Rummeliibacillus stabekisii]|uniref:phage portal protein n=1 Tax=Rummeliibacillus stabekisii TaxID=241244 RepID=UPI003720820C
MENIFKRKNKAGQYTNEDEEKNYFSAFFTSNKPPITIDEKAAMQIPAFKACVNLICNTVAALPVQLLRHEGDNLTIHQDDERIKMLENPNCIDTSSTLKSKLVKDLLLYGKAYLYNDNGALKVLEANLITEEYLSETNFTFDAVEYIYNFNGTHKLDKSKVIRFDTGTKGVLSNTDVLEIAVNQQSYTKGVLVNGALPLGVLKTASRLNEKAINAIRESWQNLYSGAHKAGKTLILENGLEYQSVSYNPEQLQLNQTNKQVISQICMLFNVSESLINDTSNKYNSLSTANTSFLQQTIQPLLVTIEEQLNKSLLNEHEKGYFFRFDTAQILKATEGERIEATLKLFYDGIISFNETRKRLDMPVIDDEKDYYKLSIGQAMRNKETGEILNINTQKTDAKEVA